MNIPFESVENAAKALSDLYPQEAPMNNYMTLTVSGSIPCDTRNLDHEKVVLACELMAMMAPKVAREFVVGGGVAEYFYHEDEYDGEVILVLTALLSR